jgi:purine-binding chemotaxis protein CheW
MQSHATETAVTTERRALSKFLTFVLDSEHYGVEVMKIREIIRMQKITPVPQMPSHVKGVINLRGKIIPVMDLRLRFDLTAKDADDNTCIVVVNLVRNDGSNALTGLVVDNVEEVLNINTAEIEDAPEVGTTTAGDCILGLAKTKNTVITLLAIERVVLGDEAA